MTQPSKQPLKTHSYAKGYGKRPVWQWVVIYLIIAVVVYGLVYFIFIRKGSSSGSGGRFGY